MAGPRVEEVATLIEECDGLTKIEELENHENTEIYKLAYEIIEKFFSGNVSFFLLYLMYIYINQVFFSKVEEDEVLPKFDENTFHFEEPQEKQGGYQF